MSELRAILDQYADTVPEVAPNTRVQEVRGRITTARRRRTAVAVVTAAVLVAGGTLAVTLPRDHTPTPAGAPTKMVGHTVPRTTTSLGDTYRYVRGYVGTAGRLTVDLPANDTGYLVRMASADSTGGLSLGWRGAPQQWVTGAGAFGSFYEVMPGNPMRLTVRETGVARPHEVALAAYALASTAPGSVGKDGISFPPDSAGQPLLAGWVGAPGEGTHTFHLSGTEGRIDIHESCANLPEGSMLKVAISGQKGYVAAGNGCTGAVPGPRPGEYGDVSTLHVSPGAHDVTVSVVDSHEHPIAISASSRLGVGIYTSALVDAVHGLPRFVDSVGHRWKLTSTELAAPGTRRLAVTPSGRRPLLVAFGSVGGLQGRVTARIGDETDGLTAGGTSRTLVAGGKAPTIRLNAVGTSARTRLLVGHYDLVD